MNFARIGTVHQGDVLIADGGFSCMEAQDKRMVYKDDHGLYILCSEGKHYLSGQEDGHYYIGLYKEAVK